MICQVLTLSWSLCGSSGWCFEAFSPRILTSALGGPGRGGGRGPTTAATSTRLPTPRKPMLGALLLAGHALSSFLYPTAHHDGGCNDRQCTEGETEGQTDPPSRRSQAGVPRLHPRSLATEPLIRVTGLFVRSQASCTYVAVTSPGGICTTVIVMLGSKGSCKPRAGFPGLAAAPNPQPCFSPRSVRS